MVGSYGSRAFLLCLKIACILNRMSFMAVHIIKNINDPRVSMFHSLKGKDLENEGIFIAEGKRVAERLLEAGIEVVSCLTTDKVYKKFKLLLRKAEKNGVPVYVGNKKDLGKIIGFRFHQGILIAAKAPERKKTEDVVKKKKKGHLLVALNNITDPENVGLIVRNAGAFGADAIIVDGRTCSPYYRKSVRVAMGVIFNLPLAYEGSLVPKLKWLKKEFGTRIIVTSPAARNKNISNIDTSGNICLVFGNEGEGVSPEISRLADLKVKIPVSSWVDSINVACASSVFLHHVSMERNQKVPSSKDQVANIA